MNYSTNTKTEPNIGSRILAGFIDYLLIYMFLFAYLYAYGEPDPDGGYSVSGLPALIPVIFWGLMTVGLEQLFGATIGNSIVGLRPISINGISEKLSFWQSLLRHLLDPFDMSFFGLVGILTIQNSKKNQRVGDMAANTIVVKIQKEK
ncbi:RDD family protein [Aquimarina sp. 2201CG5-10]|uniref:RDD family protein n=1 Tax=Aquimarina callyspongiae TaxID=3098150 RepID=UPI002AB43589|nr:RDD family protein [Aquimarina sp. 2201CG5-10]MDY8137260.1 RDD family protein [Aquimarina sp. 2201CG5-10]